MAKNCTNCGEQLTFRDSFVFKGKPVCGYCLKKLELLPANSIPSQFQDQKRESLLVSGERESSSVGGDMNFDFKKLSPILFGISLFCFVLPFLSLSAQGFFGDSQKLVSFNGLQLIIGPEWRGQKENPEPLVILAFAAAVAGLALTFYKKKIQLDERKHLLASVAAGAAGFILLWALKMQVDAEAAKVMGMARVSYEAGYWLAFVAFLAAAGVNGFMLLSPPSGQAATQITGEAKEKPVTVEATKIEEPQVKESHEP